MSAPFIPLYIDDFQSDTVHLNGFEAGVYLMLILAMWKSGGTLPNDDRLLARFAKITPAQWAKMRPMITPYFTACPEDESRITQEKLRKVFSKYETAVEKQIDKSSRGGKAKALKEKKTDLPQARAGQDLGSDQALPDECDRRANPEPRTQKEESISNDTLSSSCEDEIGFEDFVKAYPADHGAAAADDAWAEAIDGGATPAAIMAGLVAQKAKWAREKTESKYIPLAVNWLDRKSWKNFDAKPYTGPPKPRVWTGPAAIREAVVLDRDEAFAVRYLDGAAWDDTPGHEAIIVKSPGAASVLGNLRRLASYTIRVEEARSA